MPAALRRFLAPHLIVGCLVMGLYILLFQAPVQILALHLLVLFCLYSLPFLALGGHRSLLTGMQPLLHSLTTFTVLSTYLFSGLSNHFWGENVSGRFILTYLIELPEVLDEVPAGAYLVYCLLFFLWLGSYGFHRGQLRWLRQTTGGYRLRECGMTLALCVIGSGYLGISFDPVEPLFWRGEPLTHLFSPRTPTSYSGLKEIGGDQKTIGNNQKPNIILIHADAMRADRMSTYGYSRQTTPYLNHVLDTGGVRVDHGFSICSESICGMLGALSGRGPARQFSGEPLLHNLAKKSGYRNYFLGTGNFSWGGIDRLLDTDLDLFIRADLDPNFSIHDDRLIIEGIKRLPVNSDQPSLLFLRFMSSHPIGMHFNRYARYEPSRKNLIGYLFPSIDGKVAANAHDNNTLQLDDLVRQSMEILKEKGYLNNYIAVLYGDHGDALGEHGYFGHYKGLFQEEIGVPIIFWSSQSLKELSSHSATLLDIAPTIVQFAELETSEAPSFDGQALQNLPVIRTSFHNSKTGVYALIEHHPKQMLKLIIDRRNGYQRALYDLSRDPREQRDLSSTFDKERLQAMEKQIKAYFRWSES